MGSKGHKKGGGVDLLYLNIYRRHVPGSNRLSVFLSHTPVKMRRSVRTVLLILITFVGFAPPAWAAPPERCRTFEDGCHTYYTRYEDGSETVEWECLDGRTGGGSAIPGTFEYSCPRIIA